MSATPQRRFDLPTTLSLGRRRSMHPLTPVRHARNSMPNVPASGVRGGLEGDDRVLPAQGRSVNLYVTLVIAGWLR
jgi:hypothetical protein